MPTAAAHHQAVPVANTSIVSARTPTVMRSPPSIHHAASTPSAASATVIASWSVDSPKTATNGSRTRAGRGGNGSSTRPVNSNAASYSGYTSWRYSLPGVVAVPATGYGIQARPWRNASACQTKWLYWL